MYFLDLVYSSFQQVMADCGTGGGLKDKAKFAEIISGPVLSEYHMFQLTRFNHPCPREGMRNWKAT